MSDSLWPHGLYTVHRILQARILEWVAFPFRRGSSQPRDWTQVSRIAGRFFTSWATREAKEYWSGSLSLSPQDLPDPGIKLGSPTSQADSLPTKLSGKLPLKQNPKQTSILHYSKQSRIPVQVALKEQITDTAISKY